jgi:hypothetical protein
VVVSDYGPCFFAVRFFIQPPNFGPYAKRCETYVTSLDEPFRLPVGYRRGPWSNRRVVRCLTPVTVAERWSDGRDAGSTCGLSDTSRVHTDWATRNANRGPTYPQLVKGIGVALVPFQAHRPGPASPSGPPSLSRPTGYSRFTRARLDGLPLMWPGAPVGAPSPTWSSSCAPAAPTPLPVPCVMLTRSPGCERCPPVMITMAIVGLLILNRAPGVSRVRGLYSIGYSRGRPGRLAQRESASFTPKRSQVRYLHRPPQNRRSEARLRVEDLAFMIV